MATIERELKLLLEEDSYSKFLDFYQDTTYPVHQINYYFDTVNFELNNMGVTFRVREEDNKRWILCLKMKLNNLTESYVSSQEFEKVITKKDFMVFQNEPDRLLNLFESELPSVVTSKLNSYQLRCLGAIENQRRKLHFSDTYTCELDKTLYPGGHEYYEMEFEGINDDSDCENILYKMNQLGLDFKINKKSKYKRFVELFNQKNTCSI